MTENNQTNVQAENYRPKFDILYEDNHIIVVLKQQMTACCPDESKDDNLLDQVKEYMNLMKQMCPTHNVQGYIWYIMGKGPIKVK